MNLVNSIGINIKTTNYELFAMLGKDGDKWCVLAGVDIQVGIAGFGATPELAIKAFKLEMANG